MESENKLQIIVENSGLEKTKADYILENFNSYFSVAAEWEKRAKSLVVFDESQTDIMAMARVGRLALKEKRLTLEKERKRLKEQSLREGKAIDGIANVLKALIVPIEKYLDKQENFVKYKKEEEERLERIEREKKEEEERIAKEKAHQEEQERIRKENEKLKREAEAREQEIKKEKEKAEQERKDRIEKERIANEKAEQERKEHEKQIKEKEEALEKAEQERVNLEKKAQEEKSILEEKLKNIITCPNCGHKIQGTKDDN